MINFTVSNTTIYTLFFIIVNLKKIMETIQLSIQEHKRNERLVIKFQDPNSKFQDPNSKFQIPRRFKIKIQRLKKRKDG